MKTTNEFSFGYALRYFFSFFKVFITIIIMALLGLSNRHSCRISLFITFLKDRPQDVVGWEATKFVTKCHSALNNVTMSQNSHCASTLTSKCHKTSLCINGCHIASLCIAFKFLRRISEELVVQPVHLVQLPHVALQEGGVVLLEDVLARRVPALLCVS